MVPPRFKDPADVREAQRAGQPLQRPFQPSAETHELVAVNLDALGHHRPDDRVEPGQSPPPVNIPMRMRRQPTRSDGGTHRTCPATSIWSLA
jgi:hypothetical protein